MNVNNLDKTMLIKAAEDMNKLSTRLFYMAGISSALNTDDVVRHGSMKALMTRTDIPEQIAQVETALDAVVKGYLSREMVEEIKAKKNAPKEDSEDVEQAEES